MEYLASDKIGIIDLETKEIEEEELEESFVEENIGGAAINKALYERFSDDDPIIVGSGLLSGTLLPGSSLGIITAKSSSTGKLQHIPFTLYAGMEFKYSGFDYLVIKGHSEEPVFLWIHDGIADIEDASEIWGKDTWKSTAHIRDVMGDPLIQTIIIGEAGEQKKEAAQLSINFWGTGDLFGFGKLFGERNLKAIAIRGMGLIEIADPEEFIAQSKELLIKIKGGAISGKAGIIDIGKEIGISDAEDWLSPIIQRNLSSFNTPYATNSFIYLDEDPKLLKETSIEEPGVLLSDLAIFKFKELGMEAKDAGYVLRTCAKLGLNPHAVFENAKSAGMSSIESASENLIELSNSLPESDGIFSPWPPKKPIFSSFETGGDDEGWWNRRQALAYIFGIDPFFILMAPEIDNDILLELTRIGTDLEIENETLDNAIENLFE